MKSCNVTLLGPPGVGKSSLKRVLLGQSPLPKQQQNATPIVENAARAVSSCHLSPDGRQSLVEVNNEQLVEMLRKKIESEILLEKTSSDLTHQHIPVSIV